MRIRFSFIVELNILNISRWLADHTLSQYAHDHDPWPWCMHEYDAFISRMRQICYQWTNQQPRGLLVGKDGVRFHNPLEWQMGNLYSIPKGPFLRKLLCVFFNNFSTICFPTKVSVRRAGVRTGFNEKVENAAILDFSES